MNFRAITSWLLAVFATAFGTASMASSRNAEVVRATLDNGLRVVIVRHPLAPAVTTQMNYLVGADEAPNGFPGTAHAVEHMMFRGGPDLSKDQLAAVAANMGGAFNAQTTQSVTQYYFATPSRDLDVALHVEALRMRGIDMSDAEWSKERGAIQQEVSRDLSNPVYTFYEQMQGQLFAGTPYAHTPLGTRESFDKTDALMLKEFHDAWYAPNNAVLVVAGDVDPTATLAKVKMLFADIPRKPLPARPKFAFQPVKAKTVELSTDLPYGAVLLSYRLPGMRAKDYAAALVLSHAMGSKRAALFGMGMDGTALMGGFGARMMPEAGFGLAQGLFPRGADPRPVLARMQGIVADAVHQGIDPDLVEAGKQQLIANLEFKKNSIGGWANAWSEAVALQSLESPDALKQAIESVTPEAVNALARQVFDPAHALTAILTPHSSGKPSMGKTLDEGETFASTPEKPVTLPRWAEQAFATLTVTPSSLKPVTYTLSNGLKLIVQPESVSDTVSVLGNVKTNPDMQAPQGEEGVNEVLGAMFQFGTTRLNRLQFQQALDAISAKETAGFRFTLDVPAAHFVQGMQLLADNELHPLWTDQAFAIVQRQVAGAAAGVIQSPEFLDELGLTKALLPASDPKLRYATPQSVAGLSLDNMKDYYARTFRPDLTTIVIVGKVDPDQAKAVVEKTFGEWKASGARPDVYYPAVEPNRAGQVHTPDSSAVQDSVRMTEMIDVTHNDPTRYALYLGNQVLGGGFYASWLYRDLRDKSGLVYTVGSSFDLDKHRGSYTVAFGADPDKVASARAMVLQNLKRIQANPVSDKDLNRAKGILLRQIPLSESSFTGIAGQLLSNAEWGLPLDENTQAGLHYLSLTAADVQQAYAKHIRVDDFVTAVKGPASTK